MYGMVDTPSLYIFVYLKSGTVSWLAICPLVPIKSNLNSTACNDPLANSVLIMLCQQFEKGRFLFKHNKSPESQLQTLEWHVQQLCIGVMFMCVHILLTIQNNSDTLSDSGVTAFTTCELSVQTELSDMTTMSRRCTLFFTICSWRY